MYLQWDALFLAYQQQCQGHSWQSAPTPCPDAGPPSWGQSGMCPWGPEEPFGICGSLFHWWQSSLGTRHRCPEHCLGQNHLCTHHHGHHLRGKIGHGNYRDVSTKQNLKNIQLTEALSVFVTLMAQMFQKTAYDCIWMLRDWLTIRVDLIRVEGQPTVVFFIRNAVIVIIMVTGITLAILVVVCLVGVGYVGAVVQIVLVTIFVNVLVVVALVSYAIWVRVDL